MKQSKKLVNWFGYNRDDYYEFHWQRGDLHWEELGPDDDGDGCVYEDDVRKYYFEYIDNDRDRETIITALHPQEAYHKFCMEFGASHICNAIDITDEDENFNVTLELIL
jgi:hypothetical protein